MKLDGSTIVSFAGTQDIDGAMPYASKSNNKPPPADAPSVHEPIIIDAPEDDEPMNSWGAEFWGQLLPVAIVLAIIAATVTMSAPVGDNPTPETSTPGAFSLEPNVGLSHDQFDPNSTRTLEEILAEMPDDPSE